MSRLGDTLKAAAQIAAKLTPAQRRALLWLPPTCEWRMHTKADKGISGTSMWVMADLRSGDPREEVATVAKLCERTQPRIESGKWARDQWRLTPLGRMVRAAIQLQEGGE